MVARNEDEYVQLALSLASDIPALQNLRMSLRELMSKSPLCDGVNFAHGLESTFRNMWRRYCKGDLPSLKRMELLQQSAVMSDTSSKSSEPTRMANTGESSPGSAKASELNSSQSSKLNTRSCEENGGSLNHSSKQGNVGSSQIPSENRLQ